MTLVMTGKGSGAEACRAWSVRRQTVPVTPRALTFQEEGRRSRPSITSAPGRLLRRIGNSMMVCRFHGRSAAVVGVDVLLHIAGHLVGLHSVEAHIAFMDAARMVCPRPPVEEVLLIAVAFQIWSGIALLVRGGKQRTGLLSGVLLCRRYAGKSSRDGPLAPRGRRRGSRSLRGFLAWR